MSLVPGHVQVAAFGPDDEYESGEEVEYITLDLGHVEPQLVPQSSTYRLAGLDTPTPFLQLSGATFKGQHTTLLGSEIIFANGRDDANPSRRFVAPVATTSARIRFSEVRVRPLPEPGDDAAAEELLDQQNPLLPELMSASQRQRMRRQQRATKIFERPGDEPKRRGRPVGWRKADADKKKSKKKQQVDSTDDDADWSEDAQSVAADDDMQVDQDPPVAGSSRHSEDAE